MSGKQLWHQTAQRWMRSNVKWWGRSWDELPAVEQFRWKLMAGEEQ